MPKINVDPRVKIRAIPDGEIHITFAWTKDDLAQFARAFIAVSDGHMAEGDAVAVFRLRNREGADYLIQELQKARKELWG